MSDISEKASAFVHDLGDSSEESAVRCTHRHGRIVAV